MKIAHINQYGDEQTVKSHLLGTADISGNFAKDFDCGDIGYLCGLMHDIGKYSEEFQYRIHNPEKSMRVDHSTAGAVEILNMSKNAVAVAIAMAIAGHHSGLMNGGSPKWSHEQDGTFFGRLKNTLPEYYQWKKDIVANEISYPTWLLDKGISRFTMSFFIRMIYSCLVDADYLDTERFMNKGKIKRDNYDDTDELVRKFFDYVSPWLNGIRYDSEKQQKLCNQRTNILLDCMKKGELFGKGIYTLSVPTGGGKTTASLGFALKHIQYHNMKRIIYVIPYTTIIDQTAQIFGTILGEKNVLEHHSGVVYELDESQIENSETYGKVLATENWDKPVIVTTMVQFFESLFANKSSKCRKLHNIANSVIIIDEAQCLPNSYLKPCVAALSELVAHYSSTVVLCTATQPELGDLFNRYLPDKPIVEICNDVKKTYADFRRTRIDNIGVVSIDELKKKLDTEKQVLCIVNRRMTAQQLYAMIQDEGVYCLTTLSYPADRKKKIKEINYRLKGDFQCKVIATSLIEAGVDLDFPIVFRQETGLDSVIQAAGRCNREGKRKAEESVVSVFSIKDDSISFLKQNIAALKWIQKKYNDLSESDAVSEYFNFYRKQLLGEENLDQKDIIRSFEEGIDGSLFPFATVSEKFRLIENDTKTIYVPMDEGASLVDEVISGRADRNTFRKLGQYSINVYPNHFKNLWDSGCIESVDNSVYILRDLTQYDENTGLRLDVETGNGFFV
jgi:CRISPR-associated endonuclease/helicase Cas3